MTVDRSPSYPPLLRRREAAALLALAGCGLAARAAWGQATPRPANLIDVHRHFTPPFLEGRMWTPAITMDDMDKAGIAKAVLSSPTNLGGNENRPPDLVRKVNEFGAQVVRDHKDRFLFYTALPMPNVDASLKEIVYALDTLKAVGVSFTTSYGRVYISDERFEPIWQELNRRKAIAYFHPQPGVCCEELIAGAPAETGWLETPYETGRAVVGLLLRGAFTRYRDIKWVFAHSGGTIPMLAGRINNLARSAPDLAKVAPNGAIAEFQRLYYETGNANSPPTLAALLKLVPATQVMFGTDHPFVTGAVNVADLQRAGLSAEQMAEVASGTARRLFTFA